MNETYKLQLRQGLTYEEWLDGSNLPQGFRQWEHAYRHWDQGQPICWAVHCYKKEITANRHNSCYPFI